ncbi:MAG: hypothetical protein U0838_13625 [Chloroflexota bacterium]
MANQTRRAATLALALLFAACSGSTSTPSSAAPVSAAPSAASSESALGRAEHGPTEAPSEPGAAVIPQTGDLANFTSTVNWRWRRPARRSSWR